MAEKGKYSTLSQVVAVLTFAGILYIGLLWNPAFRRMRSDLEKLTEIQDKYKKQNGVYLPSGVALNVSKPYAHHGFIPSPGVIVRIWRNPEGTGWWAEAFKSDDNGFCVVFVGTPKAVEPASEDNVPACTRARRKPLEEEEKEK